MIATRIMLDIKRQVAAGKVTATVGLLRDLLRSGDLRVDAARLKLRALNNAKAVSRAQSKAAFAQLS